MKKMNTADGLLDYDAEEKRIRETAAQSVAKKKPGLFDKLLDSFGAGKRWEKELDALMVEEQMEKDLEKLRRRRERDELFERLIEEGRKVNEGDRANVEFQRLVDDAAQRSGVQPPSERVAQAHAEAVAASEEALQEFAADVERVRATRADESADIEDAVIVDEMSEDHVMDGFENSLRAALAESSVENEEVVDTGYEDEGSERDVGEPLERVEGKQISDVVTQASELAAIDSRFDDILQETAVQWLMDNQHQQFLEDYNGNMSEENYLEDVDGQLTSIKPIDILSDGLDEVSARALARYQDILVEEDAERAQSDVEESAERVEFHDPEKDWELFATAAQMDDRVKEASVIHELPGIGSVDWSSPIFPQDVDSRYILSTLLVDEYLRLAEDRSKHDNGEINISSGDYTRLARRAYGRFLRASRAFREKNDADRVQQAADMQAEGFDGRADEERVEESSLEHVELSETPERVPLDDGSYPAPPLRRVERLTSPERVPRETDVLAIGDLHGNAEIMRHNLESLGLIDAEGHWNGGEKRLVFHGDILADRGTGSLEAMRTIDRLRNEARRVGGDITVLAGNHEDFAISFLTGRKTADGGEGAFHSFLQGQGLGLVEFLQQYVDSNAVFEDILKPEYRYPTVLNKMREHPEGRAMLENMCQMKIADHIDDALFVHTDLTPEMARMITEMGVDEINAVFQRGLRDLLLEGGKPSPDYQTIVDIFLHTNNRHYLNVDDVPPLRDVGINRVVHGHTDHKGEVTHIGGLEIQSVDRSAGKRGSKMDERSIGRIDMQGRMTQGWDAVVSADAHEEIVEQKRAVNAPEPIAQRPISRPRAVENIPDVDADDEDLGGGAELLS